jgi:SAM-dependent methyltransferase
MTSNAYQEDLAYVHDVGAGDFAKNATTGLLKLFRKRGIEQGRIIDLGCGSGIWAEKLTAAGYEVIGVDQSPAMIKLARQRAAAATFHLGSFLDFEIPNRNVVTALGEVLNCRFDERNNRTALKKLCRRVFNVLPTGGLFVFDLAEPGRHGSTPQRFYEGPDWYTLVEFLQDKKRDRLTRRIVTFRKLEKHWRRSVESHELQLYRGPEIAQILRDIGFRTRIVRRYGNMPLFPQTVAFIARKPASKSDRGKPVR